MSRAERVLLILSTGLLLTTLFVAVVHPRGLLRGAILEPSLRWYSDRRVSSIWDELVFLGHPIVDVQAADTVLVFSDYRCPQCQRAHYETIVPLLDSDGDVAVYHVNLPLVSLHPDAPQLALFSICATVRGDFAAVHDRLMAMAPEETIESLIGTEDLFGTLVNCTEGNDASERLQRELNVAAQLGIDFTPALVTRTGIRRGIDAEWVSTMR